MARRRAKRTPPTPAQRQRMMIIGAALVFVACFVVIFDTLSWEQGNFLALAAAVLVLFLVFILPIIGSVRHARRGRT